MRACITHEYVIERLNYDPASGIFVWKPKKEFDHQTNAWNARYANTIAGTNNRQYIVIKINSQNYMAHRLAYFIQTKEWQSLEIDHINGNKSDNRWINLRIATRSENMNNQGKRKHNKSGFKGVYFDKTNKIWLSRIHLNGKKITLGRFNNATDAAKAYKIAALENHKEFIHPSIKKMA